jgi:hypothetical protein
MTTTEKEELLKLKTNEIVKAVDPYTVLLLIEHGAGLGACSGLESGENQDDIALLGSPIYIDWHNEKFFYDEKNIPGNPVFISGKQWLNRHQVFVPQQLVEAKKDRDTLGLPLVYRFIGMTYNAGSKAVVTHRESALIKEITAIRGCDDDGNPWPEWGEYRVIIDWNKIYDLPYKLNLEYKAEQAEEIFNQIGKQLKTDPAKHQDKAGYREPNRI